MKLENKEFGFDNFAAEMAKLKNEQHFDFLVTIVGEDFGEYTEPRACLGEADCQSGGR